MKPSRFTYHRPTSVEQALGLLDELGPHAKVLAGGQSLIPIMNMRLAAPEHIIDINRIDELSQITIDDDKVVVGALVRHADLQSDSGVAVAVPVIAQALGLVAHPAIRNRGTTVGSIVHADPSAEMPAVLALTGGTLQVASVTGQRDIAADELFLGPLETSMRPGEIAISATFPVCLASSRSTITEVSRRHGDYALAGVAIRLDVENGEARSGAAAYFALASVPILVDLTDQFTGSLAGLDLQSIADIAVAGLEPEDDIHATAAYRLHLARTLTYRALCQLVEQE